MTGIAHGIHDCLRRATQLRPAHDEDHDERVGVLSAALGRILGLEDGHITRLRYAAQLHDVGKLAIPDAILEKPAPLDGDEWKVMHRHSRHGYEILKQANHALASFAATIALQHHECWDGSGYPEGLKGEAICREARIVGLCDVYDAMREPRAYKTPLTHEYVMHALLEGDEHGRVRPAMFEPELLETLEDNAEVLRDAFDTAAGHAVASVMATGR